MWRELFDYGKRLFSLQRTVDRHAERIEELQKQLDALTELVRDYRAEQKLDRTMAAKDMENLALRLKVALLESGRNLPPLPPGEPGIDTQP